MLLNSAQVERRTWLRMNKGVLNRIAADTHYSICMVSLVYNGHRPSGDGSIERELRQLGAPGWTKKGARKS